MNKIITLSLLGLALLSTACGSQKGRIAEHRKVKKAPISNSETGVMVSNAKEEDVAKLLEKNQELTVRVINPLHGIYELHGISVQDVKTELQDKNVIVEKNRYVNLLRKKQHVGKIDFRKGLFADDIFAKPTQKNHPFIQAIKDSQKIELTGESRAFVESCKLSGFLAPEIAITTNIPVQDPQQGLLVDMDQKFLLGAGFSKSKADPATLEYLWVLKSPNDSAHVARAMMGSEIDAKSDTTGLHIFSVVVKDSASYCDMFMGGYYVTVNRPFKPTAVFEDSASESIDRNTFWHVFKIGADQAWIKSKGEEVVVAVIDSGVDYNHPALARNILLNEKEIADNGIDDDNNGFVDDVVGYDFGLSDAYPYDDYGHGTHVAGIAASNVIGAAKKAKILPIKFGAGFGFDVASVAGAIKYAVDNGANILNMSFGWPEDYAIMREVMAYAEKKGVLVVAAAGNDGEDNGLVPGYPCNYKNANILSIAASDTEDALTDYSNFGLNVHLAAPGGSPGKLITSTYKANPKNTQFVGMMGTSMASPLVAGVAAQVWAANPNLTAVQVRAILLETGKTLPELVQIQSSKVIDASAAVQKAKASAPAPVVTTLAGPQ